MVRQFVVKNFDKGIIDTIEDFSIPEMAASKSLNWLTKGDKIELSGGYTMVDGDNAIAGTGKVTGLQVSSLADGTKQAFCTHGKKAKYLDSSDEWQEIGTDILTTAADGEDVSLAEYVSVAGYQTWLSSPNSGLFKIMTANPGDYVDLFDSEHRGYIDTQNSRLHLWYNKLARNYLYGSYKDTQNYTNNYTKITSEAIGISGSTNYTGILAFKAGDANRTCFTVSFTDGTQDAQDDNKGAFTGDATGTINYMTGAYNITFDTTTTGSVTATYSWEDSSTKGIADFSFSGTRLATEGYFLPQNTGGDLLNVLPYGTNFYCIHEDNAYLFSMPVDDLAPTNQIWRRKVGMKNWRAAIATGEGIYYIDTGEQSAPRFKLLTLGQYNDEVVPVTISYNLDLTGYDFSNGAATEQGDYIIFTGSSTATDNDRVFAFHKIWKSFDTLKYFTSALANNDGELWAGDSISNNVYKIFFGFSADGSLVENYWEGKLSQTGVDGLKKTKRLTIEGEISTTQQIKVFAAYDRGAYIELGEIDGTGSYVNAATGVTVGQNQIGIKQIAGGGLGTIKYHYRYEMRVRTQKFDEVKLKFVAQDVGYASVSTIDWYDIQTYGQKNLKRYRQTL